MELDVIELDNGLKLPVIDAINYQNKIYILAGVLNEEETDIKDNLSVFEKIEDELVKIEDTDLEEKLISTFEKRIANK